MRRDVFLVLLAILAALLRVQPVTAGASDTYRQAMHLAATHRDARALALLAGLQSSDPNLWRDRGRDAAALIAMRHKRASGPVFPDKDSLAAVLSQRYIAASPAPEAGAAWVPALLAALAPGAGHAWLGRYHDAVAAAVLVWPMLLLTLWAWRRRMGPVTVFFALLAVWLWSGNIFSAISLNERASFEAYLRWWQGLWQASALPGRPW